MRWILPTAILAAGCADHAGTYLDVSSAVTFDHVEVYVGTYAGERTPTTPRRPEIGLSSAETQRLFYRHQEPTDVAMTAPTTTWTDYLPATGDNLNLGDYVLVVASSNGQTVAIGELFDFKVPTDAYYRYPIQLVPVANEEVETWGRTTPDCIRWTRPRGGDLPTTVAVVRYNDQDCDDFTNDDKVSYDCEPLLYCDGTGTGGCVGRGLCLDSAATGMCSAGACSSKDGAPTACQPETCLDASMCQVCTAGDPDALVDCSLVSSGGHADFIVPVIMPGFYLCTDPEPYTLTLRLSGADCLNPQVLAAKNWHPGPTFQFDIAPGSQPSDCLLKISPPAPQTPFEYNLAPHLVIGIDNPPGSRLARSQFVIGLVPPSNGVPACPAADFVDMIPVDFSQCGL